MFLNCPCKKDEATRACEPTAASNATPNCTRSFALPFIIALKGVVQPRFGVARARIQGIACEVML